MAQLAKRGFVVFVDQTVGEPLRSVFFVGAKDGEEALNLASSDHRAPTRSVAEVARELRPAEITACRLQMGQVLEQPTV